MVKNQAGKGDKPRNCFSKEFRENFDNINWKTDKKFKKIYERSNSNRSGKDGER